MRSVSLFRLLYKTISTIIIALYIQQCPQRIQLFRSGIHYIIGTQLEWHMHQSRHEMIFPKNSKTSLSIVLNGLPSHVWSSTLRPLPLQLFLYALCGCIHLIAGMGMADQQGAPGIAIEHLTPAATLDSLLTTPDTHDRRGFSTKSSLKDKDRSGLSVRPSLKHSGEFRATTTLQPGVYPAEPTHLGYVGTRAMGL